MENIRFAVNQIGSGFQCMPNSARSMRERHCGFLFGMAAQATTMAAIGDVGSAAGVVTSCVPIIVPIDTPLSWLDPRLFGLLSETPKKCAGRITTVGGIQISLAMAEVFLGDPVRGLADLIQGGFGLYVVTPEGLSSMPTYILWAGFSGMLTLSHLQELYMLPKRHTLLLKYCTISSAVQPLLCLLGCYYGWNLLVSLRENLMPLTQGGQPLPEPVEFREPMSSFQSFTTRGRTVASLDEELPN